MLELNSHEMFQSGPEQVTPCQDTLLRSNQLDQPICSAQLPAEETFKITGNYCIQNYTEWYVCI
jgi:hypothetical protein